MAKFKITSPTGEQFQITAPDDATDEQVQSYAQSNFGNAGPSQPHEDYSQEEKSFLPEFGRQLGNTFGRPLGLTARYAAEGATALPNMVGNAANSLINYTTGSNLGMPSQGVSDLLTQAGLPNPNTPTERVIGDAARGIAGAGTSAGIAGSMSGPIAATLAQSPLTQMISGATGGASAGATREAGGGPLAQMAAGFAGGIAPAVPAAASGMAGSVASAADTVGTGIAARNADQLAQAVSDMKAGSSAKYQASREAGVVLNQKATDGIIQNVNDNLLSLGKNNDRLHGDTLSILDDFTKAASSGPLSLDELDQYRKLFSGVVKKNQISNPEDALKASKAINAIDDSVNDLNGSHLVKGNPQAIDALKEGRAEWSKAKKFENVADIISKSDGDPNRLKANLQRFVLDKNKMRGFTPDEVSSLKNAARNSAPELLLKAFGKFGFDLGGSMTAGNTALPAFSILSAPVFGPTGLGVAAGGTLARQAQKMLARGKAEQALQTIERRPTAVAQPEVPDTGNQGPLLLSGPQREYVSNRAGVARPMTPDEQSATMTQRQRQNEMGLTPDVQRTQYRQSIRQQNSAAYDAQEAEKLRQVDELMANHQATINQMVGQAVQSHKDLAQATGQVPTGELGRLLLEAIRRKNIPNIEIRPPTQLPSINPPTMGRRQ